MSMNKNTTLQDLIGIEDVKLGFFQEAQKKVEELKTSNRKLQEKQREIQAILDGIADVMIVLSRDFQVLSVNHVYHQLFSNTRPEGKYCHEVLFHQDAPCESCPVRNAFSSGSVTRTQAVIPGRDKNRYFDVTASPLHSSQDPPDRFLLFMRDVTLEKEYQAQLIQTEKMATIGTLAAGVAHEINNPLTAIQGFSRGIERRIPQLEGRADTGVLEDIQEYLGTILKECSRCQDIVQNLLTFSRPRENPFHRVNLRSVILDCLKILRYRLKKRPRVDVDLRFDPEHPEIYGDEAQLKQVVLNLVSNALDAVGYQGKVSIAVEQGHQDMYCLSVEDTGHGIPSEHLDRLFDPFFTTKPVGQGTGIGLSTCYTIVKAHEGQIIVCSEPENGSSFCVKLPQSQQNRI